MDFRKCTRFIQRKVLYIRLKSIWVVEMYILWTCINVNKEDVHAWVILGYVVVSYSIIFRMYSPVLDKGNRNYIFS